MGYQVDARVFPSWRKWFNEESVEGVCSLMPPVTKRLLIYGELDLQPCGVGLISEVVDQ
jgi:hypothetical protein